MEDDRISENLHAELSITGNAHEIQRGRELTSSRTATVNILNNMKKFPQLSKQIYRGDHAT